MCHCGMCQICDEYQNEVYTTLLVPVASMLIMISGLRQEIETCSKCLVFLSAGRLYIHVHYVYRLGTRRTWKCRACLAQKHTHICTSLFWLGNL